MVKNNWALQKDTMVLHSMECKKRAALEGGLTFRTLNQFSIDRSGHLGVFLVPLIQQWTMVNDVITTNPVQPGSQSLEMGFKAEANKGHSRWQAMVRKKGLMGSTCMVWMVSVNLPKHAGYGREELMTSFGCDSDVREGIHENAEDTRLPKLVLLCVCETSGTTKPLPQPVECSMTTFEA